jgi:citrate lyase subunit beta/citryl-CoA lyase
MRPIRSLLFAPANQPELVRKFLKYRAGVFAIDLEDSTPEAEKVSARRALPALVAYLRGGGLKGQLFVRINPPRSPFAEDDIAAAGAIDIDGIILPKLEDAEDLQSVATTRPIIGIIETAAGLVNAEATAARCKAQLCALAFGAEDFITGLGGRRTAGGLEVLYARSRVLSAARAAGIAALDQVFVHIRDDAGFRQDAEFGRQLGYDGKMCLTPRQAEIANEVFSPTAAEIERSRRLVQAHQAAKAEGRGVTIFEGEMIDEPLLKRAQTILINHEGGD